MVEHFLTTQYKFQEKQKMFLRNPSHSLYPADLQSESAGHPHLGGFLFLVVPKVLFSVLANIAEQNLDQSLLLAERTLSFQSCLF